MFYLTPPRHISTLPNSEVGPPERHVRFTPTNRRRQGRRSGPHCAQNLTSQGTTAVGEGYRVIRPRLTSTFDVLIVYC